MIDCSIFYRCSSPICPLLDCDGPIYFADEDACSKHNMVKLFPWIKTQRKLAKKSDRNHEIGYFTVESLTKIKGVSRRTAGMNPDKPGKRSKFESKVAVNHKRKYTSSPERIKTLREGLANYRKGKTGSLEKK